MSKSRIILNQKYNKLVPLAPITQTFFIAPPPGKETVNIDVVPRAVPNLELIISFGKPFKERHPEW